MKIIDLLNKIANGEEVPRKVKYKTYYWEYKQGSKDYKDNEDDWVFSCSNYNIPEMLNNEVEIIEEEKKASTLNDIRESYGLPRIEEKKIPEKLGLILDEHFTNDELQEYIYEMQVKINEIIDYLKSKGE
jgi:hypothetical protein